MPQSTTMISPPYSYTVMFLPISFSPPSGMIFKFSAKMHSLLMDLQKLGEHSVHAARK